MSDPYARHYFTGFISGEGSFTLGPRAARVVIKLRRDDRPLLEAFRDAFGNVLQALALTVNGRLTCTEYETARAVHRHWPKRDTIAIAFGGWYEALRSAGLADRAARRPSAAQLRIQLD
jgi:hypothetical protein